MAVGIVICLILIAIMTWGQAINVTTGVVLGLAALVIGLLLCVSDRGPYGDGRP